MEDDGPRFSPSALRHRDPHAVLEPVLSDPAALARIRQALLYFDEGNQGVPWDLLEASVRARRDKRAL
jgi:hypothetical protein